MSSSVFTESPIIPRNNESHLLCSDTEITRESTNLVVVYGKNGINVDKKGLESLMDERKLSTISVVRLSSPTPSQKDENKKSKNDKTDEADDLLLALENSPEKENDDRELVGLTVEEFYAPEEAKKLAKEILNYAGISNPLEINTNLEFQRFVIQNDHCYTPLTSPSQVKGATTTTTAAALQAKCTTNSATVSVTNSEISSSLRLSSNRSLIKGSIPKKGNINTSEKQSTVVAAAVPASETTKTDGKESEAEEEEEYSEYTESSFSSESDNDRDSDLDFDVNDRGRRKKVNAKKKGRLIGRKVTKRRQTSNTDRDSKEQDEEKRIPVFRVNKPGIELRRKSQSAATVAAAISNNSPSSLSTSKTPLKVYSGSRNQTKTIHIISQHPTPEPAEMHKESPSVEQQQTKLNPTSTSVTAADSSRSILRTSNPPPKRKSEGVFTEISTFLTQGGESSKPNLKVTQLKLESPQTTTTKGFMPLGIEAAAKNQLPAQISIQTHQSSTELAAENDKQLDLIDSIVKDEMKKSSIIEKDTMNENIPHLVKMLESTETAILAKSKVLPSSTTGSNRSSTYTHSVEDIDITNAPLLETPEDDIPEDLLQHVAELMESKNIQDVIDKEVLTATTTTASVQQSMETVSQQDAFSQSLNASNNMNTSELKNPPRKETIEIVRKDGRVIKLPPIEAPTTRAKRRAQTQGTTTIAVTSKDSSNPMLTTTNAATRAQTTNSRRNSAVTSEQKTSTAAKKRGSISSSAQSTPKEKEETTEDEESDSEDDPNKLWCICRQPHNNRFMICCDVCEDWFHGTCVNITKAMGLEMEIKGVEWRCPNCMKKEDPETKKSIQTRINELSTKKHESNLSQQQQQFDETKRTNDNNKKQQASQSQAATTAATAAGASGSGVKKFEQTKKAELNRRKSISSESLLKKSVSDSAKSLSSSSTEQTQKKIAEMFKTIESATTMTTSTAATATAQKRLSFVSSLSESKLIAEAAQKSQGQTKQVTVQKKNPDNLRQPKDEKQKKIQQQQQQQENSLSESGASGSESSRPILKLKTAEKQSVKVGSSHTVDPLLLDCVVCKKPVRPNSIYCSDDCIRRHANNSRIIVSKASKAAAASVSPSEDDKIKKKIPSSFEEALAKASEPTLQLKNKIERVCVFERKSGRILTGSNAPTTANLKKWLQDNPTFEVVQPGSPQALVIERSKQKQKSTTNIPIIMARSSVATPITPTTPTMVSPSPTFSVKGRTTLQIEMQPLSSSTPKLKKTIQTITVTKSTPVTTITTATTTESKVNQSKSDSSENKKIKDKDDKEMIRESLKDKKEDKDKEKEREMKNLKSIKKQLSVEQTKEPSSSSSNPSTSTSSDTEPVRLMVRKTLKEQLMNRMSEVKDLEAPKLTEQEVEEFANETEMEMYKLFNSDVGTKYKTKYRSLMFNIKDRKNETLFQKICGKVIEPKQLVRMSPEEMASQELAQWRQNENKHQLEMIKKSELDLLSCKKNYVLKTHKGEEVIESKSTDQLSLDITIPVEDVVTVLNSSAVSSTSELTESHDKEKDNYKVSSSHESSSSHDVGTTNQMVSQESGIKEKTSEDKKKVHSSSSNSGSRDREHRDRHHRQKEKHRHKKRSRSRSRSRDRKHRSPGREEKRNRSEKDRNSETKKERSENREKGEMKERSSSSKDRHENSQKDREKSQATATTTTTAMAEKHESKSKQSTKQLSLSSSISQTTTVKSKDKDLKSNKPVSKLDSISKPDDYNLIDKILESTKTVEEAANLIGTGENVKDKEKEKEKQTTKASSSSHSSSSTTAKPKFSELNTNSADSDQEPSSTVTIATPPEDQYVKYSTDIASIIWSGSINMIDVATFQIIIQPVCGIYNELDKDLPLELDVVGRISPETVWEYIVKIKKSPNKEIVIIRLVPACESENLAYTALYTYLDKRKRLGVVKTTSPHLKDFYILPLGSQKILPQVLQSTMSKNSAFYEDDSRPDLLMGIVIRIMGKRPSIPSAAVVPRSFHPPAKIRKTVDTSVIPSHMSTLEEDNFTPPSSPKRKLESSKNILTVGRLPPKTTVSDSIDIDTVIPSVKLTKSYNQDDEPYSPGGSSDEDHLGMVVSLPSTSGAVIDTTMPDDLKRKMDEINRQIEAQKMEIAGMLNMDQSKGFSSTLPSVDLTPALANISIPSNLHQILASIKQTPPIPSTSSPSSVVTESQTPPPTPVPPPRTSSSASSSSNVVSSIPSIPPASSSTTTTTFPSNISGTSGVPPPPLIGSLLNTLSSDEEYVPGPVTTKISAIEVKDHGNAEQSSDTAAGEEKSSTTALELTSSSSSSNVTESFTHDVDLRVEYPQLSKKPRWDQISNPPPPGLEDEYS